MSLEEAVIKTALAFVKTAFEVKSERDKVKALRALEAAAGHEAARQESKLLHAQARKRAGK